MLVDQLLAAAEGGANRPAVADPYRALTYGGLVRLAAVMRRQVMSATACPHVGIMLPSSCAFAGTFYGALWAGRVAVPLNFLLQPGELSTVVRDAGLDTIFTIRHFAELAAALPAKAVFVEDLSLKREVVRQYLRRLPPAPVDSEHRDEIGFAPRQGEHTRAVLGEAGLAGGDIDALIEAGVAGEAS